MKTADEEGGVKMKMFEEKATPKQKAFLKKIGLWKEGINKKEASETIRKNIQEEDNIADAEFETHHSDWGNRD